MKNIIPIFIGCMCWLSILCAGAYQLSGEEVSFQTEDDFTIKGTLGKGESKLKKNPAMILIHQGGSDRNEWKGFFEMLLKEGYVVLAYDVRGHGKSNKVESIVALFNDPNQAPLDLKAAIEYLQKLPQVDPDRIGIVGASIGSNLASMAMGHPDFRVKTAVAISGKTSAAIKLSGLPIESLEFKSIYHIASENEQGGAWAKWAKELYNETDKPRKLEVVKGSNKHGVHVFEDDPSLRNRIIEWLKETL